jgi:hypothetical protein
LRWIKQLKTALARHYQFSSVRPSGRISSLPECKPQRNNHFCILLNSGVEGHWKYIIMRPHLQDKCLEALKQMQMMCTTLLPSDGNQFRVNVTTLEIYSQESVTHLLLCFKTYKRTLQ